MRRDRQGEGGPRSSPRRARGRVEPDVAVASPDRVRDLAFPSAGDPEIRGDCVVHDDFPHRLSGDRGGRRSGASRTWNEPDE